MLVPLSNLYVANAVLGLKRPNDLVHRRGVSEEDSGRSC